MRRLVLAGKLFILDDDADVGLVARKLKDYRVESEFSVGDVDYDPVTEVTGLEKEEELLTGTFSEDVIGTTTFRDEEVPVPSTEKANFTFTPLGEERDRLALFVQAKKQRANQIANKIGEVVFIEPGKVVEATITHSTLKSLHESSPESTKVIFFDQVDLPNVNKLSLYGQALSNTSLYQDYLNHGLVWYVVYEPQGFDFTLGLTRNCVVTVFSTIEEDKLHDFVVEEVVPLVETPS